MMQTDELAETLDHVREQRRRGVLDEREGAALIMGLYVPTSEETERRLERLRDTSRDHHPFYARLRQQKLRELEAKLTDTDASGVSIINEGEDHGHPAHQGYRGEGGDPYWDADLG